jgi:hypothetical protein
MQARREVERAFESERTASFMGEAAANGLVEASLAAVLAWLKRPGV